MPQRLRIFISSPGDVPDERLRAGLIVDKLSQDYSRFFTIEAYRWEHEPMLASGHFQDVIEPPSAFDIVVLILWSRLGTPVPEKTETRDYHGIDGRAPVTGTEWEYEEALKAARAKKSPDLLAFRNVSPAPIDPRDPDAQAKGLAQLRALNAFWSRHFADRGVFLAAYTEYRTLEEFAQRFEESLRKLIERRIKNISARQSQSQATWLDNPFRGLESYEFEHAPIFFGRDAAVTKATEQLAANARAGRAFLLVSGASGSGKSSLVKAGVVPRLMKPQRISGIAFLRRAVFRPATDGADIFHGLAKALIHPAGLPELIAPGQDADQLAKHLRSAVADPAYLFANALGRLTESERGSGRLLTFEEGKLILVVDQLEEMFTVPGSKPEERVAFIKLLSSIARSGTVWVIGTMRLDFWQRAIEIPEMIALAEGQGRIDLAKPSPAELTEMIRKPAAAAGLIFEVHPERGVGLDAVLAEHAASELGVLPLLSFTLDAIYAEDVIKKGGHVLTFATYRALGGLEGAIATRADEIVMALPPAAQNAVPRVLRALTTISSGSAQTPVARTTPIDAFAPGSEERGVIDALTAARLILASSEDGKPIVRLAHEALLSAWQRAKEQLAKDRRDLETRALAEHQYARWVAAANRDKRVLLLRDPDLASAIDLLRRWGDDLTPELQNFIVRSDKAAKAAARLRWGVAAAVMICLAVLAAVSIGALYIAEVQRNDALIAQSYALARDARSAVTGGDPTLGMLLALAALPRSLARPDRPFVIDAEYSLADAVANRRERAVLSGHAGNINSVAFSSDGSRVVTAGEDGTGRIWDATTGAPIRVLSGHAARVVSASYSRDGKRIVTAAADGAVGLWNAATGANIQMLRKDFRTVNAAIFSPDGTQIVTASDDGVGWTWDGENGNPGKALIGHSGRVLSADFSPDGRRIVTASEDMTARIWDAMAGAPLTTLTGHTNSVTSAAFSSDGTRVVTASDDETARLWDSETGSLVAALKGHTAQVTSAAFSPDGKHVVTASDDHTVRLWDAGSGALEKVLLGHDRPIYSARFSPDSRQIVTASDDRTARLWDAQSGAAIAVLGGYDGFVYSASFSPDGKILVTGSHEQVARLWNVEPAAALAVLGGHVKAVTSAVYAADGTRLATASADATARIWDAKTGALFATLSGHEGAVNEIAFSPDGTRVATASDDRTARLWNAGTGTAIADLRLHQRTVKSVAFSPDGTLIVTGSADGTARLWDGRNGSAVGVLSGHTGSVNDAVFSPDGKLIATASSDKTGRLWDVNSKTTIALLTGHNGYISLAAFSPDGMRILTASGDQTARLWNGTSGAPIAVMKHENVISSAGFSPDGTRIVTASWDHTARLWDGKTGAALEILRGHANSVWSAVFSFDGRRIVTASQDKTSRIWDVATGSVIAVLNGHEDTVRSATFSPDGTRIATASVDGTARLWKMPPLCQALIDTARKELPRELSPIERSRYFLQERQSDAISRVYDALGPLLALLPAHGGQRCQ